MGNIVNGGVDMQMMAPQASFQFPLNFQQQPIPPGTQ